MTSSPLDPIRALFNAASELPPARRAEFLARECPDPGLRAKVEDLLASHDDAGAFLSTPAADLTALTDFGSEQTSDPLIGFMLGRYRIVDVLGRGGMGVVYRAEQNQPRRTVAVKVIRADYASQDLLRRFRHEAEALGRLKHPAIAQIFEAGEAPDPMGRNVPFFAMELIVGRPILQFAAGLPRGREGLRDRLALFAKVCDGVQHAHQRGVIHRDLKPANILVESDERPAGDASSASGTSTSSTDSGGGPQPKILDFGVARVTAREQGLTSATGPTLSGQVVGTLAYMSPEQVRGEVDRIDVRSDVYALGVVLYELLVGDLPYAVRDKPIGEAARIITDEDPSLPGTRSRELRGDLETIALKALEKEPDRRYQSAADLAADIRRFLTHLPIVARPATAAYQVRKFARRHRVLVAGLAGVFLALVLGVAGTSIGLLRARHSQALAVAREIEARAQARKAEKSVEFLVSMLTGADPDLTAGREVTVRELLDRASTKVGEELASDPDVQRAAREAIARTYRAIGDAGKADEHFHAALDLTRKIDGQNSLHEAELIIQQANVQTDSHHWRETIDLCEKALAILEPAYKIDPAPATDLQISRVCAIMGGAYVAMDKMEDGERFARRAYQIAKVQNDQPTIATAAGLLSTILQRIGGPTAAKEGEEFARLLVETMTAIHGPSHSQTLQAKEDLGWFLVGERRDAEGLALLRDSLSGFNALYGPNHRRTLNGQVLLATAIFNQGDYATARTYAEAAVAGLTQAFPDSPELGTALWRLGIIKYRQKEYPAAEVDYRESLRIRVKIGDPRVSATMSNLAGALEQQGHLEEALEMQRSAVEYRRKSGALLSDFGTLLSNLAGALAKNHLDEEAERTYRESVEYDEKVRPGHPLNGLNLVNFGLFLHQRGRSAEAEPMARKALELSANQPKSQRDNAGKLLSMILDATGKPEEAAALRKEMGLVAPAK